MMTVGRGEVAYGKSRGTRPSEVIVVWIRDWVFMLVRPAVEGAASWSNECRYCLILLRGQ
jgi:hypothetical protein